MKTEPKKNQLIGTLKIADIDTQKLSEGSRLCLENLQGTSPLTQFRALPEPVLAGR